MWLAAAAVAATWSDAVRPPEDGRVELAAGQALRVDVPPGATLSVTEDGWPVEVRGIPGGVLVPAAGTSRVLTLACPAPLRVRTVEDRARARAWDAWERAVVRAARRQRPSPPPPPGIERTEAGLRARAGMSPGVQRLGLLRDAAPAAPLVEPVFRRDRPARPDAAPSAFPARGPGVARLGVRPTSTDGGVARLVASEQVGTEARDVPLASTGAAPSTERLYVAPGRQTGLVDTGGAPAEVTHEVRRARERLGRPAKGDDRTPVDAAESAYLTGDHAAALERWRALLDAGGAVGELAGARVARLTPDPAELDRLARAAPASAEGADALADAVLSRAAELPEEVVLGAVLAATHPDPRLVARWLDGTVDGTRAAGPALLDRAPDLPAARSTRLDAARELSVAAQARRLPAVSAGGRAQWTSTGPGIPRGRWSSGQRGTVAVSPSTDGRMPVVRLLAPGPVRYAIDGHPLASPGGRLDMALAPGDHAVEVTEGELLLLDPELAPAAERVYEWTATPFPAAFDLPDPGVSAPLFVDVVPTGTAAPPSVLAVFDDGRVTEVPLDASGRGRVLAGPHATRVTLLGPEDGSVGLAIRARLRPSDAPEPLPSGTVDELLAEVEAATRRVDAGEAAARVDRALRVASLGALETARRDLSVLAASDPEQAARVERRIAARVPTRDHEGGTTAEAALAEDGRDLPLPADPVARAAALDALPSPTAAIREATVEAWLTAGDPVRAERTAAGVEELRERVSAALEWSSVPRADRAAGLVEVQAGPESAGGTLAHRLRLALLALPWPADQAIVVTGDDHDLVRLGGGDVVLELACRDETLAGEGCRVPVRAGNARRTVELADGATAAVPVDPSGTGDVEVTGPGPGRAVAVRVLVDGAPLPPRATRSALRALPGRPVELRVAGGAVLRAVVISGRARATAGDASGEATAGGTIDLAVPHDGAVDWRIEGDATVLLYRGVRREPVPEAPLAGESPEASSLPPWIGEVFAHVPVAPAADPATVGRGGTWRVGVGATRDVLDLTGTTWSSVDASGEWMRSWGRPWAHATVLALGPALAGALEVEGGTRWATGRAWLDADAGLAAFPDEAGHLRVSPGVLQDLRLTADTRLRGGLTAFAGWWSPAPAERVDPTAWSTFSVDHPFGIGARAAVIGTPWRDVRLEVGGSATSNAGPSLDRLGPYARAQLLVGATTVLGVGGTATWRLADDDRASTLFWPALRAWADHAVFVSPRRRLGAVASIGVLPTLPAVEGSLGVSVTLPSGRGLRDLPPEEEPFRSLREDLP